MNSGKTRSSNIELLRILAMIMIVFYHIIYHTVYAQLTDVNSMALLNNGLFNNPVFYRKLTILVFLLPFGKIGNTVFLMISGYFLIAAEKIDLIKISKKLLFPLLYAGTVLVIASFILHFIFPDTFFSLISITGINSQSWFLGYYFAVIVIAALFINKYFAKADRKKYLAFLLVLLAFISFGWTGTLLNNLANSLRVLLTGVFAYSLGGYIRLYEPFKKVRTYIFVVVWIAVYGLIAISYYNMVNLKIETYALSGSADTFIQELLLFNDFSAMIIILSVCVFELFRRIRIPNSRFINFVGASTLFVYLFHDHALAYSIWNTRDWITILHNAPHMFLLQLLLWGLGTFAVGVIMYVLYLGLGKLCHAMRKLAIKDE